MSRLLKYQPELSKESLESISKTFKLFQDKNGIINCENLITSLKELKYDQQEPVIYDIIDEICSANKTGLNYDKFVDQLNQQLQDRSSQKSTERTYALFAENPDGNFTFEDFKRVAKESGDNSSDEELKKIFNFASSNGKDIPYEEFHAIMTKSFGN